MNLTTNINTWRILIVDDEPDNLNLASDLLEFSGAQTAKAKDGEAGLEMVEAFKPNLILLDLEMPRMDGWQMFRQLRTRPELDDVPVVALTALAMLSDAEKVRAAGFDGYVVKPFRVKALLDDLVACIEAFALKMATPP
ncbi:MAG TPA: response regulator, partial [Aggregatilineaceae bacterium]|nr:response regulator [Aggregatilineaceae bacterium]